MKVMSVDSPHSTTAACGHVSCFWCVHRSMNSRSASNCPICRHPYGHFPAVCLLLHSLLLKMYPVAYKKRDELIFGKLCLLMHIQKDSLNVVLVIYVKLCISLDVIIQIHSSFVLYCHFLSFHKKYACQGT